MRRSPLWLLPLLFVLGCTPVLPSATQYPSPVPSAAQPGAAGRGDVAYARRALDAIRSALRDTDPEDLDAVGAETLRLPDDGVEAGCAPAGGRTPTLVCHFGPSSAQPVAQGIFWYENDVWEAQLYPQASQKLATERASLLAQHGCRLGCSSGVTQARLAPGPDGPELTVVVDMGYVSGRKAEEVQVLIRRDREWEVLWVPAAGDWNYGHANVVLNGKSNSHFQVRSSSWMRQDPYAGYFNEIEAAEHRRFTERWMRKGSAWVMADRSEEPTPYSTLVRLVHYLSVGGDEKAATLIASDLPLEDVRGALAQKPKRQGWTVTRWGEHGFLVEMGNEGKPAVGVRFERDGEDWILAEVWRTPR